MTKNTFRHTFLICLIVSFFSSIIIMPVQGTTTLPSSFYITLKSILSNEQDSYLFFFNNGSAVPIKNFTITLSLEFRSDQQYNVKLRVESNGISNGTFFTFSNETNLFGQIVDGRLVVNSKQSIFKINPEAISEGDSISLCQTPEFSLLGLSRGLGRPETAIQDYRIESIMVKGSYSETNASTNLLLVPPMLAYDPETGILDFASGGLSDVLLKEIGITYMLGGLFQLSSYSENLPFKLVTGQASDSFFGVGLIVLTIIVASIFAIIFISALMFYKIRKKHAKSKYRIIEYQLLQVQNVNNWLV